MAKVTITGCDPYDGTYEVDLDQPFNTGELNIIKQISGVRAQELQDAFAAGDTDMIVALAVVGLYRAGKVIRRQAIQVAEKLWASEAGSLTFDNDDAAEEEEVSPLEPTGDAASV